MLMHGNYRVKTTLRKKNIAINKAVTISFERKPQSTKHEEAPLIIIIIFIYYSTLSLVKP